MFPAYVNPIGAGIVSSSSIFVVGATVVGATVVAFSVGATVVGACVVGTAVVAFSVGATVVGATVVVFSVGATVVTGATVVGFEPVPSLNVYVICVAADIFPFLTDLTDTV